MMEPLLGLIELHLMSKNIVIGFGDNSASIGAELSHFWAMIEAALGG